MQVLRTSAFGKPRFRRNRSKLVLKPVPWRATGSLDKPKLLPRGSRRRIIVSYVLFSVGGALCTYVAGSYAWMYGEQVKLLHQWKAQNAATQAERLTRLSIPKINLRDVVLEGISTRSLLSGPAHMSGTAAPGANGNNVIAGHRDTFFRRIHSLRYGDDVYLSNGGKQYHYVVKCRRVVEPTDLSVLGQTADPELTLITCYPTHAIGPASRRLIVVARLAK
jgi:sortase A